jgi:hypothetical protein
MSSFGFKKIVDVDVEEKDAPGGPREDLRIHDRSPVLVIDIKGVQGHPEDAESTQSQKHALMRLREWREQGTDVQPLTIINSQRHLPPDERDLRAFRQEIIKNAEETHLGLMTSWDLWTIARNAERLKWPNEAVQSIFYKTGRIDPIPDHYKELGTVVEAWEHSFGLHPQKTFKIGDRLAVEDGDSFEEFEVTSMRVDNNVVQEAATGSNCGVGFPNASKRFGKGSRVFAISSL